MHNTFPVGGILTGGLGLPACEGLAITTQFNLFCGIVITVPTPPPSRGGGSRPMAPGEIQNFYKPVDPEYLVPQDIDPFSKPKNHVQIKISFKDTVIDKEYLVSNKRMKAVITVINLINTTKEKISTVISNIRRISNNAILRVKNLRNKHK